MDTQKSYRGRGKILWRCQGFLDYHILTSRGYIICISIEEEAVSIIFVLYCTTWHCRLISHTYVIYVTSSKINYKAKMCEMLSPVLLFPEHMFLSRSFMERNCYPQTFTPSMYFTV